MFKVVLCFLFFVSTFGAMHASCGSKIKFIQPIILRDIQIDKQQETEQQKMDWLYDQLSKNWINHKNQLTKHAAISTIVMGLGLLSYHKLLMPFLIKKCDGNTIVPAFSLFAVSSLLYHLWLKKEALVQADIITTSCVGQNPISFLFFGLINRFYSGYVAQLLRLLDSYEEIKEKIPVSLQENFETLYVLYATEDDFETSRKPLISFVLQSLNYIEQQRMLLKKEEIV